MIPGHGNGKSMPYCDSNGLLTVKSFLDSESIHRVMEHHDGLEGQVLAGMQGCQLRLSGGLGNGKVSRFCLFEE
jgi:hypothetical protein